MKCSCLQTALIAALLSGAAGAAEVIGVTDGDTLTVLDDHRPIKIRLANIDAPEKKQSFGRRSQQALANLCFGKDAQYQEQDIDRYGRTVAVVTCAGVEASRAQVALGLAWVYPKYNKNPELPAIEASARAAGAGLWRDPAPVPPWEWRRRH